MMTNDDTETAKNAGHFFCEKCDFKCSKKSNYDKHLTTRKHEMKQSETNLYPKSAPGFSCNNCEKIFNSRTTLWRHKKKCIYNATNNISCNHINNEEDKYFVADKEFVMCTKADSKHSDTYNKLVFEAMGGKGENDVIKEDKIIKKVAKEIIVDK